jgi:DNA-binding CsgD family transcriptional regulator
LPHLRFVANERAVKVMDDVPLSVAKPDILIGTAPTREKRMGQKASVLTPWLRAQAVNVTRHATALRPFRRAEFGAGDAAPSEGHIQAVNRLIGSLRRSLLTMTAHVTRAAEAASQHPTSANLEATVSRKERAQRMVEGIERIWDFYFELFGQRQGQYAEWLLSCDRIALDCYRVTYTGLGTARSVPAPPPFCYMRTGFAPATFRRGIPLTRLGKQLNPFPLIQLPYHRLVNPSTLGAVLHEVSHNLQSDLGLARHVPRRIADRLLKAGCNRFVASIWTRWNREMFADMAALLLGGPGVLGSVMDVVGRGPDMVLAFNPQGVHPTPYLRTLINVEMLRRMGFEDIAEQHRRVWKRIYPNPAAGDIPRSLLDSFAEACALAVDAMCFRTYPTLGDRSLAQVIPFQPKEQTMIEEASRRLAAGMIPESSPSPREQEISRMVAKGCPNKTIAGVLNISCWTVCTHIRRIFAKLGVASRAAMVARLLEENRTWRRRPELESNAPPKLRTAAIARKNASARDLAPREDK